MAGSVHNLSTLFAQLGQASDEASIASFIASHRPLAGRVMLHEAPFWSAAQASFLREAIGDDADCRVEVDAMNLGVGDAPEMRLASARTYSIGWSMMDSFSVVSSRLNSGRQDAIDAGKMPENGLGKPDFECHRENRLWCEG